MRFTEEEAVLVRFLLGREAKDYGRTDNREVDEYVWDCRQAFRKADRALRSFQSVKNQLAEDRDKQIYDTTQSESADA
jgi:hypothetical protein